jgi:hypothetical protein
MKRLRWAGPPITVDERVPLLEAVVQPSQHLRHRHPVAIMQVGRGRVDLIDPVLDPRRNEWPRGRCHATPERMDVVLPEHPGSLPVSRVMVGCHCQTGLIARECTWRISWIETSPSDTHRHQADV